MHSKSIYVLFLARLKDHLKIKNFSKMKFYVRSKEEIFILWSYGGYQKKLYQF